MECNGGIRSGNKENRKRSKKNWKEKTANALQNQTSKRLASRERVRTDEPFWEGQSLLKQQDFFKSSVVIDEELRCGVLRIVAKRSVTWLTSIRSIVNR